MATTTTDVLIIGAGPTGLTTATLLAHNGVRVRILDKKAGLSRETRAVVMHAKTLELLDKLDLTESALTEGEQFASAQLMRHGKIVGKLSFRSSDNDKRTPYPFSLIYGQDQTEHLLHQSLMKVGVDVEWNSEMLGMEQTANGVQVRIRDVNGNEETVEAQWVIGADGARSAVRHALSLGFVGETYEQTMFIADVAMEWTLQAQQGGMDFTRDDFFLFVPMRGEGRYRMFGTLPPELANKHSITLDDVRHTFNKQSGLQVNFLSASWISIYHIYLRMAEQFRVGRIFLLGDAAHIHSPAGGQGMNTGIGDAFNLAWKLALVVKGQAHETLLDSYEAERIPFARAILRGSDMGFQLMTANRPLLRWIKLFVVPLLFGLLSPLPLFQRNIFWLLSQLWTNYRKSPVVTNVGTVKKGPQAGDRAPYGFFEIGSYTGKSIFTLFKGQEHHLLLFAGNKPVNPLKDFRGLEERVCSLLDTYAAPISLHTVSTGNRKLHKLYGAEEPTLFLVRPDGHIAYRGNAEDLDSLTSYLDKLFVERSSALGNGYSSPINVDTSHAD